MKIKKKNNFYDINQGEEIGSIKSNRKIKSKDKIQTDEVASAKEIIIKNYNYNTLFLTSKYATAAIEGTIHMK
jgi:hypothetical protein